MFLKKKTPKLLKETWFEGECKNLLRKRQLAYENYSKISSPENWSAYGKLRLKFLSVVKEKLVEIYLEMFHLSQIVNNVDCWNFINNVGGRNQIVNVAALKKFFGDLIVDDKKIAEHFNLIFSNLGQYFGREYEIAPIFQAGDESFSFCSITENDCYDILKQINPHKPTGPSKVPPLAILDGLRILVPHLTFVLNECTNVCVFPAMLKSAVITPIFKKADILDPLNYRFISITTTFLKALKIVCTNK